MKIFDSNLLLKYILKKFIDKLKYICFKIKKVK